MDLIQNCWQRLSICAIIVLFSLIVILIDVKVNYKSNATFNATEETVSQRVRRRATIDKPVEPICKTKECRRIGKTFKSMINTSVNPCDDFYEFVCGKYAKNSEIPKDMTSFGSLERANEKVYQILRQQLSRPSRVCDPMSVKYASELFKGCNDFATLESRGVQPLIEELNSLGGWPIIANTVFDDQIYSPLESIALLIAKYSGSAIIEMSVLPDLKDNLKNILYFGSGSDLSVEFKSNQNRRNTFPPLIPIEPKMNGKMDTNPPINILLTVRDYIFNQCKIMGAEDSEHTLKQIDELFMFSSRLQSIESPDEELEKIYNKITFKEFNQLSNNRIDWLWFTNKVFSLIGSKIRFKASDYCVVTDLNYFRKMPKILSKTPNRVIANFLGLSLVQTYGDYTVEAFRELDFQLQKMFAGIEKAPELWKVCLDLVESTMSFAISRKYIEENFDFNTKQKSTELVNFIQKAFDKSLQKNPVLDKYTRKRSVDKLRLMTKNVGYPEWLFNDSTLNSIYNLDKKCEINYLFECIVYLSERLSYTNFISVSQPINTSLNWPFAPLTTNAAYLPSYNSITVPGALISTFFSCNNPSYVNYATFGLIIGHEITHGFDNAGRKFDERGNYRSIWDSITQNRFDERENCFINQYNSFCEFGFCVNGENTVGENTADGGGIRNAYKAYKMCNQFSGQTPERLPYVSQYTPDQLFFISYASLWCDSIRPEALEELYESDVHSPPHFRVNGVLQNHKSFAKAFKCQINTTMNPKKKCILW